MDPKLRLASVHPKVGFSAMLKNRASRVSFTQKVHLGLQRDRVEPVDGCSRPVRERFQASNLRLGFCFCRRRSRCTSLTATRLNRSGARRSQARQSVSTKAITDSDQPDTSSKYFLAPETKYTTIVSTVIPLVALPSPVADQLQQPGTQLHSDNGLTMASEVGRISEATAAAERRQ
jgi:hypothetical protein